MKTISDLDAKRRKYAQEYYADRVTPDMIDSLLFNQVFVFGSNVSGMHGGGAAATAVRLFGAQMGKGEGLQGQSYAIPTMERLENTGAAVHRFCQFAKEHPEKQFLVTKIGCGIAGYDVKEIAPFFEEAIDVQNVSLPRQFWEVLGIRMF